MRLIYIKIEILYVLCQLHFAQILVEEGEKNIIFQFSINSR